MEDDAICAALGGTCVQSACCTIPFFSLSSTTTATITTRSAPPEVEGVASSKRSKYTTSVPITDAAQEKKICVSGLSSAGECATDDNCPALHRCEDKKCCYNT
ncbi:hypothetical protein Q1695_003071 [Nippostrongylus brasiliensis]|nr:hypothetical protein Q1695_003071 [Nippostrongylus brasiliensis]